MCLDVLGMHGEVEEVWSGSAACWFDRPQPVCAHTASALARLTYPAPPRDRLFFTTAQPFPGRACAQRRCACVLVPVCLCLCTSPCVLVFVC